MNELMETRERIRREIQATRPTQHAKYRHVLVESTEPNDKGRFPVVVDGAWMQRWTRGQIVQAIADGVRVEEKEAAA